MIPHALRTPTLSDPLPTFERILDSVCVEFGVRRSDLLGKCRDTSIADARHVAQYLTREIVGWSYPRIGREFQQREHSSAMYAHAKIARLVATSRLWAECVERCRARLTVAVAAR